MNFSFQNAKSGASVKKSLKSCFLPNWLKTHNWGHKYSVNETKIVADKFEYNTVNYKKAVMTPEIDKYTKTVTSELYTIADLITEIIN